jgi:hypothetical protein
LIAGLPCIVIIASGAPNKVSRFLDNGKKDVPAYTLQSLASDDFDIVVRTKAEVEKRCPGVVSCDDILSGRRHQHEDLV